MSSTVATKRLSQHLQTIADRPAELGGLFTRALSRDPADVKPLRDIEAAMALVTDDRKRQLLATTLYRWLDVHRAWMADTTLPAPSSSVYVACVPFTLKNLSLVKDPNGLMQLMHDLDLMVAMGPSDELFPSHRPLALAFPLVDMSLLERWAYSFMLANSHCDTPVDRVYGNAWGSFIQQDHEEPEQAVFAFAFSLTVPNRPSHIAPKPGPVDLPMTAWGQHMTDVLIKHAANLNTKHPELGLELHALTTLSEAVEMAADLRFRALFKKLRSQVGRQSSTISFDAAQLAGLNEEMATLIAQERHKQLEDNPPSDEDLFGSATLGQATCVVGDVPAQFLQANLFSRSGQLTFSANMRVPLGTTPSQALRWWRYLDTKGMAQIVELPTEHVSDIQLLQTGKVRDLQGKWIERELLNWGLETIEVYQTAKWSTAFGKRELELDENAPEGRLPVPEAFESIPLMQGVRNHYRPAVADAIKKHLVRPGMSRQRAFQSLVAQFPALMKVNLADNFNAFLPSAMWAALNFQQAKGVLYRVHPSVQEQMALTNVENRFPVQLLHSPFPVIYLHLEQRTSYKAQDTPSARDNWLDGAYVQDCALTDEECAVLREPPGTREITLTFAFNNEAALVSLSYPSMHLLIRPKDDRDLAEMLRQAISNTVEKQAEGVDRAAVKEAARKTVLEPLFEICKILLYVSFPEARLHPEMKRSQMMEKARELTGKERQRLMDRAVKERDYVVVGPVPPMQVIEEGTPGEGTRTVRPHPRQGYIRAQPYGEGKALRRPKWIPPVIVNRHLLGGGDDPTPKTRKVI